jgi:lipopolysaccharide/colanic/teichoic acid biosynthesis glycosyltransferase
MRRSTFAAAKRALDLLIASFVVVGLSPVLALIALVIRLDSRGPAILRQSRVGLDGRDFEILKFRTMVVGAHTMGAGWLVASRDPRITRVGHFLRRWSLDELPQLFNVLRGEMSIVGPRPTLRYQVEQYTPHQRRRLEALPGITGWAQVQGRNDLTWAQRIELDVWYVDHRSLRLELEILVRTLRVLVTPSGVYNEARGDWGESGEAEPEPEPVEVVPDTPS